MAWVIIILTRGFDKQFERYGAIWISTSDSKLWVTNEINKIEWSIRPVLKRDQQELMAIR